MATIDAIPRRDVLTVARAFLVEAYEGAWPEGTWFVSPEPDAGVLGTLARLSAEEASRPARPGGPTIAAHAEHLRWYLALVNATLEGAPWQPDWSASWSLETADPSAWEAQQAALRREFEALRSRLEGDLDVRDPLQLRGILALAPHSAYHLGAIRQLALQRET